MARLNYYKMGREMAVNLYLRQTEEKKVYLLGQMMPSN